MRRFEELTRSGQVRRMRVLAQTALAAYDLGDVQLTPLAHFFNTTFRIDTCSRQADIDQKTSVQCTADRYVIRIHRANALNKQAILSELLWLQALRYEADLIVPEPVPMRDGQFVMDAAFAGVPEPRHCVVFRWVDGHFLKAQLGFRELEQVGVFMAKLHLHAERFSVPEGFVRPRWDYEGVRNKALGTDLEQSRAHLSQEEWAILKAVGKRVQHTMDVLGEGRDVFGLIHADFYEKNYLFFKKEIRAIDFDGCGWGYYLFDIGVVFSTLQVRPEYSLLRKAFLQGYRQVRWLSVEHEALIDTFIAARLMGHILWLSAHVPEPAYGERALRRIAYELGELRTFLG